MNPTSDYPTDSKSAPTMNKDNPAFNEEAPADTPLSLYGTVFNSRLLLGTAQYPSLTTLQSAIHLARPAMITAALRRSMAGADSANDKDKRPPDFFQWLNQVGVPVLPNTAGCYEIDEAVTTAQMARELFNTRWIKLELIGDSYTLQPDMEKLVVAAKILINEGFFVLPYCTEDLVACQRLLSVGCEALMPWASPIGSAQGPVNAFMLKILRARLPTTPLIVDAGLGLPSHAATVMEWGFDGVLLNSAVSGAGYPLLMAEAFALAVRAGRQAYCAKPLTPKDMASASTPVIGTPFWHQT